MKLLEKVTACRIYFKRLAAHAARKMAEGANLVGTREYSHDDVAADDGAYESPTHTIVDEIGNELG